MKRRRIIVLTSIGLVLLAVFGWQSYGWWLKHKLERYKAELVARGEKLTLAELLIDQTTPETNSAKLFLSATAHLQRYGVLSSNLPLTMRLIAPGKAMISWNQPLIVGMNAETNTWDELAAEIEESREGLEMLRQLIERPGMDFGLDYSQGMDLMLPHLSPLKQSSQVLSAAAMLDLHRGNAAAAARNLQASLALVKGFEHERLAISQLVRIAMTHITISATWELLQSPEVKGEDLERLQTEFAELDFLEALLRSIEMERAIGGITFRHYRTHGVYDMYIFGAGGTPPPTNTSEKLKAGAKKFFSPTEIRKNSNELLWQSALSYEDELFNLQSFEIPIQTLRAMRTNHAWNPVLRAGIEAADANYSSQRRGMDMGSAGGEFSMEALRSIFCGLGGSIMLTLKKVQTVEAFRALTVTAIALKRYQLQHGGFPKDLSALVPQFLPALPVDPVDGQPLHYQLRPDGAFLLYSIGEDGVDNGGDSSNPNTSSMGRSQLIRARDWVWPQPASAEEIKAWEVGETRRKGAAD